MRVDPTTSSRLWCENGVLGSRSFGLRRYRRPRCSCSSFQKTIPYTAPLKPNRADGGVPYATVEKHKEECVVRKVPELLWLAILGLDLDL